MNKDFRVIIGKRIRGLRIDHEMTQMDLADRLGMTSTGAISQIESGKKGMKLEMIIKAARVFGIQPSDLIDGLE